jgi:hypothetical protein
MLSPKTMNSIKKEGNLFFKLQCNIHLIALKDVAIAHILTIFPPKSSNLNPPKSYKYLTIKEKYIVRHERHTNCLNAKEDGKPLPFLNHI